MIQKHWEGGLVVAGVEDVNERRACRQSTDGKGVDFPQAVLQSSLASSSLFSVISSTSEGYQSVMSISKNMRTPVLTGETECSPAYSRVKQS